MANVLFDTVIEHLLLFGTRGEDSIECEAISLRPRSKLCRADLNRLQVVVERDYDVSTLSLFDGVGRPESVRRPGLSTMVISEQSPCTTYRHTTLIFVDMVVCYNGFGRDERSVGDQDVARGCGKIPGYGGCTLWPCTF